MKTPESDKMKMLVGHTLRTPGAALPQGKPPWHQIPEKTDALVAAVYTGGGNSVGVLRGQYRTANGFAVLDFGTVLEEMSRKGDK